MRLLHGPGHEADVFKPVESSFVGEPFLGPEASNNVDPLFEPCAAFVHLDAEDVELLGDERAPETGVESAVADVIQHCQLAGEFDRVVKSRDHRAGDEPDAPRPGRDG